MVWRFSKTAATNSTADSSVNYAEGQSPSSLNDSARAVMARIAQYRDDIAGAIVTGGSATAYTVASNQVFDTLAHLDGAMIAFTPHATNTGTATLSVDGLPAKPLRASPGVEIVAGTTILGTPYVATYSNTDSAWYLRGGVGNPYSIPLLGGLDYWDTVAPNSAFIFPLGQAISRTVYATAFARLGTRHGAGDGSTTFNVPDKSGRVSAMVEGTATRLTTAGGGVDGATMGAAGGAQSRTLITANLPAYTPSGTNSSSSVTATSTGNNLALYGGTNPGLTGSSTFGSAQVTTINSTGTAAAQTFTGNAQGGTSTAFATVPPIIVCNYIIRILVILLTFQCVATQSRPWHPLVESSHVSSSTA